MQILDTLWVALRVALVLTVVIYLLGQVRRPSKWLGRPFVWIMNNSHSTLTDWGLEHTAVGKNFTVLDVGCGGGRTIQKLLALAPEGKVYGVDYAAGSVAMSRSKNAEAVNAGRAKIKHATVSELPFADNKFDLITAIETQYYWPDLRNDMQEILRVLKPGGTLLIIAESYAKGPHDKTSSPMLKFLGVSNLGVQGQRELFTSTGYADVEVFEENKKGWICVSGKKPAAAEAQTRSTSAAG